MTPGPKRAIKRIGIVVRPDSAQVASRARRLAAWLEKRGKQVLAHADWAGERSTRAVMHRADMMREADLVVVLGGDGSLLGVARLSGSPPVPVIGINHGEFGFLTDSDEGDLYGTMARILAGKFTVQHRSMLDAAVRRADGQVATRSQALNDAVITRGNAARMLTLDASVDGKYLTTYQGDGLVVATPTGSTAYSLSAGGPVVDPEVRALIVTPISAHTLTSRPVVLDDRARVVISPEPGCRDAVLTVDGQERIALEAGSRVEITRSRNRAAILTISDEGFYGALRRKIHWGARGENSPRAR